jgi:predicted HTH transcriptional regulator
MYPVIAVRELFANALIHQDFFIRGVGPMIEIFSDRIEITNPGVPLVKTERFLDSPPKSRNEALASFMRRIGVCEERGSGIDKAVSETEFYQLPAPLFEVVEGNTRATLFAHRPLSKMDRQARVRATYLHACLKYVQREFLTNSSLRERFGIQKENSAMVSRIIKEALFDKAIKLSEPESESRKYARYVPIWA